MNARPPKRPSPKRDPRKPLRYLWFSPRIPYDVRRNEWKRLKRTRPVTILILTRIAQIERGWATVRKAT